ncbi:hypothetical protein [Gracilibacillus alcaliphilus]|uniref:hypothetical protein n=1 Tax=Gracilibacillus alcaliphilus TaxID=1401441 RepID=UPI00195B0322|nr:hypothetical protein [Gracilibacillus alcaliphilus]MBM7676263.1 hypothetical protein [Gracilibacillus alcaliphilus]
MCKHDSTIKQDFIKSETEYLAYMQAFLHFLSCYLLKLTKCSITAKEKQQIERQLLISLVILEKLHYHILLRKKLLEPIFEATDETSVITDTNAEKLGFQLLNTKTSLLRYSFQSDQTKHQCLIILRQLLSYYPIIPVINQSPHCLPWVAEGLSGEFWNKESQAHDTVSYY